MTSPPTVAVVSPKVAGTAVLEHLFSLHEVMVTMVVDSTVTVGAGTVVSWHTLSEHEVMVTMSVEVLVSVEVAPEVVVASVPLLEATAGSTTAKAKLGISVPSRVFKCATKSLSSSLWSRVGMAANLLRKAPVLFEGEFCCEKIWKGGKSPRPYKNLAGITMLRPAPVMSVKYLTVSTTAK